MSASSGRFTGAAACDAVVVVVTYNSARDIDGLLDSLRPETADLRLRVVVVDNDSTDDTVARLTRHHDVTVLAAGGNLGYAGGINVALAAVRADEDILILNPDLRVHRGAVAHLRAVLHSAPDIGIAAPRILDEGGRTTESLHREPTALRAWGDALLGPLWRSRPGPLTEWVRAETAYRAPRDADWASGAALMIRSATAATVGAWDERFFLYSEETDYCRRVRDAGYRVRFDPDAVVAHRQGGSGSSPALDALLNVNRVRYMRKHAPASARLYRLAALAGTALRARRSAGARASLRSLGNESSWSALPHAVRRGEQRPVPAGGGA